MRAPKDKQITISFSLYRFLERILFLGVLFYLFNLYQSEKVNKQDLVYQNEVLNDTIKSYKNKNNEMVSRIKAFESLTVEDFLLLKTKDSTINKLQKVVSNYKKQLKKQGSVTHLESSANITIESQNEAFKDNLNNWVYKTSFNKGKWLTGSLIASKDSTKLNLRFKNEYDIVLGRERIGLFKTRPFVEVINRNPYSENKKIRAYQTKLPENKLKLGVQAGYGITKSGLSPYIGFGINYKPF